MIRFAAALLVLLGTTSASAANPVLNDKFNFKLGAFFNEVGGDLIVAREPLPETSVDLEDVLGIDISATNPWLGFRWRFGDRWSLNFHYDKFDQSGGAEVSDEFNIDGVVYPVGARIETNFRADAYVLDVGYSIWKSNNFEAGLGLGVHAFDLEVETSGSILLNDFFQEINTSSETLIAPVPNLRVFATYAFTDKTSATFNGGWLSLDYDDFNGAYIYLDVHLEYRFTERWGAGIGGQYTEVDIKHDSGDDDFEEFDIDFTGVQAYITYSF